MRISQSWVTDDKIGRVEPSERNPIYSSGRGLSCVQYWWPCKWERLPEGVLQSIARFIWATFFSLVSPRAILFWKLKRGHLRRKSLVSACEMCCHVEMLGRPDNFRLLVRPCRGNSNSINNKGIIKYKFALVVFERPLAKQREFYLYKGEDKWVCTRSCASVILVLVPKCLRNARVSRRHMNHCRVRRASPALIKSRDNFFFNFILQTRVSRLCKSMPASMLLCFVTCCFFFTCNMSFSSFCLQIEQEEAQCSKKQFLVLRLSKSWIYILLRESCAHNKA